LQTDYLDAYLIHWPNSKISIEKTFAAMEELRQEKKIRHIGLSNVSVNHLKKALEIGVPITWVQVEMHPYFFDKELLDFCSKHAIAIQAWRPLNLGSVREDVLLQEIGRKYEKTACQVALRWIVQHGCIPLPGSKNEKHIRENLDILNFVLTEDDMDEIDQRALRGTRFRLTEEHGLGFSDELDFTYEECWPK
jgi:diketogulonate reductase-like aldo/keto reductase